MKVNVGVNLNKELTDVMRSIKIPKTPKSHSNHHAKCHSSCDNTDKKDYTFEDAVNSVEDCLNSAKDNCIIKSCTLNKDISMNKKIASMIGIGTLAATVVGASIYSSIHNGKRKKKSHMFDISYGISKLTKITNKYM